MEETYSKWPEWQKVYVKIKILTQGGCLPLPRGYIHIQKQAKICIKSDFKDIFFETCNKWAKWQGLLVDIRILSSKGCPTLPRGYICSAQSRNRYNSRIVLRKVRILTLLRKVGILTLRKTILELFLRKVGIGTKWEYLLLYKVGIRTKLEYRILQFISSRFLFCFCVYFRLTLFNSLALIVWVSSFLNESTVILFLFTLKLC